MLDGPQVSEALLISLVPCLAGYLGHLIDVWLLRRALRPGDDVECDVRIVLRQFENPVPAEEILSAGRNVGHRVVPSCNWLWGIGLGRDASDEAAIDAEVFMHLLL